MKFWLLNLAALVVIATAAGVHGRWTHRWHPFAYADVDATLASVPAAFGDWVGREASEEDRSTWRDEGTRGLIRRYTHRETGATVLLMLRGGPPGPIGRHHTPGHCYHAAGFADCRPAVRHAVTDSLERRHEFWVSDFEKPGAAPRRARVFWGFSGGKQWVAPADPRLDLAEFDIGYKLYVVRGLGDTKESPAGDVCEAFLRDALPAIDAALFPAS